MSPLKNANVRTALKTVSEKKFFLFFSDFFSFLSSARCSYCLCFLPFFPFMFNFRILQWNCTSIHNKVNLFNCTLFIPTISYSFKKLFWTFCKILYRLDTCVRPDGGLLITVSDSLSSPNLLDFSSSGNEIMGIHISMSSFHLNIINVYFCSGNIMDDI